MFFRSYFKAMTVPVVNLRVLCGDFPFGFEIELAKRLTEDIFIREQNCF